MSGLGSFYLLHPWFLDAHGAHTHTPGIQQYLDVDEVRDEGHEHHLISIPTLPGVHFNPSLQLPPLATVTHEDLKEEIGSRRRIIEYELKTTGRTHDCGGQTDFIPPNPTCVDTRT